MELGLRTPYKPNKVENLKKFEYDKPTRKILQRKFKKVSVTGGNPLVILTNPIVTEDSSQDPLSITSVGTTFTITT
jgi:hypothetical protein